MSNANTPGNPAGARALQQLLEPEQKKAVRKRILEAVVEDPEVDDGTNVSVTFEDREATELHLIGTVADEPSKKRAEALAREHGGETIKVVNDLLIE